MALRSMDKTYLHAHLPPKPKPQGPLEEFDEVLAASKRSSKIHKPPLDFIIETRLLEWFRRESSGQTNAGRLLKAIIRKDHPPNLIGNLLDAMNHGDECWLLVFTILLQLKMGKYIQEFWRMKVLDKNLPITKEGLRSSLQDFLKVKWDQTLDLFVENFYSLQYELLTTYSLSFVDGGVLDPKTILPIRTYEPVNNNKQHMHELGPEKVFQVEIPYACIPQKLLDNVKAKPHKRVDDDDDDEDDELYHRFAIKTLKDKQEYEQENFAYGALNGRQGIVQCLGFWELKKTASESEFHLLLEYGQYDLHEYFDNYPSPSIPRDILSFWTSLSKIAVALDEIHNVEITVEGSTTSWFGWHLDIKPENILHCKGGWKIADPGFAQFVRDFDAQKDSDGLPVIPLSGGTTAYGPPEQTGGHGSPVTQRFDIWSLGCVFSEAATWLLLGRRGVEIFRSVRKSLEISNHASISMSEPRGDDCFHTKTDISKAVKDWHDYLRNSLRKGDNVTEAILDFVQKRMLVRLASERASSKEVVRWLEKTIKVAEKDKTLCQYQPEKYFRHAFEAEQMKAVEEWANPPPSTTRTSNRYKSMRFEKLPLDGAVNLDNLAYDKANMHTPLLTDPPPPHRGLTMSTQMTARDSMATTAQVMKHYGMSGEDRTAQSDINDVEHFDFWGALQLLESQGWVPKGTLERPSEPEAPNLSPPLPPSRINLQQPSSRSSGRSSFIQNTPHGSQAPKPTKRSSLLSSILKRNKNSKINKPATQSEGSMAETLSGNPGKASYLNQQQKLVSDSISGADGAAKYKNPDFDDFFDKRDIVFLIDNGSTMGEHWPQVRALVTVLVALLHGQDDNGMEMYFTSSMEQLGPFTEPKQFVDQINQRKPKDSSGDSNEHRPAVPGQVDADDIRIVLGKILDKVTEETLDRKLTLIVLTDGIWKKLRVKENVADTFRRTFGMWEDDPHLGKLLAERGLSIQFVLFGNDRHAREVLGYLDDHLKDSHGNRFPDIIDVEPATGNVKKMILGSLSDQWDEGGQTTVASDDPPSVVGRNDFRSSMSPISGTMNSPTYNQDNRIQPMYEDPMEYTSPSSQRPRMGTGDDPAFLVFGMHDTTASTARSPLETSPSSSTPKYSVDTPSRSESTRRRGTRDSTSTAGYRREAG